MGKTKRTKPHWVKYLEQSGDLSHPWYKWSEKRNAHKTDYARTESERLKRADKRAAKRDAKSGVERTEKIHVRSHGAYLE